MEARKRGEYIDKLEAERDGLLKVIEDMKRELNEYKAKLQQVEARMKHMEGRIESLKNRIKELEENNKVMPIFNIFNELNCEQFHFTIGSS